MNNTESLIEVNENEEALDLAGESAEVEIIDEKSCLRPNELLALGIVAVILAIIGAPGIVVGAIAKKQCSKYKACHNGELNGKPRAAMGLAYIAITLGIIMTVVIFLFMLFQVVKLAVIAFFAWLSALIKSIVFDFTGNVAKMVAESVGQVVKDALEGVFGDFNLADVVMEVIHGIFKS